MSTYLGDFLAGATVHFLWSTNDGAGGSVTRTVDGTISVYKNNGTTQDTDGITNVEDFDGVTGVHACTIDLSADATFYSVGANFSVVLAGATIDGQSVNAVLREFSVQNRNVPTAATIAFAVWSEDTSDWVGEAGTMGLRLTRLPTANAGANGGMPTVDANNRIVGIQGTITTLDALDTAQDAQHATTQGLVTTVDTVADAIKLKTDNLPSDPADQSLVIAATDAILAILGTPAGVSLAADIATRLATSGYTTPPTTAQIADKIVVRNIAGGGDGTRTIGDALKRLRNHVGIAAGEMTVYEADDTTPAWAATVTTAAGNPVSDVNPT